MKRLFYMLVIIMLSCTSDPEVMIIQLLDNPDMEQGQGNSPKSWQKYNHWDQNYTLEWNDQEYFSPNRSLAITGSESPSESYAFWQQTVPGDNTIGRYLELTVHVKGENIQGVVEGYISVFGHNQSNNQGFFLTGIPEGTFDWTSFTMTTYERIKPNTNFVINVFLTLRGTGTVYFDDVTLTYKKQE